MINIFKIKYVLKTTHYLAGVALKAPFLFMHL